MENLLKLEETEARRRGRVYLSKVEPYAAGYHRRRSLGEAHPVQDFLFQYYPYSTGKLRSWHPGFGVAVPSTLVENATEGMGEHLRKGRYRDSGGYCFADISKIDANERGRIDWIGKLLELSGRRPPQLGCLGLHEWAMVYGLSQDEIRHTKVKLRMAPREIRSFLDSQRLCCTHYDAFRFFTEKAIPRNQYHPSLESRLEMEQPGCIHTNMDLYKWAYKLVPWCDGELLADCFLFALTARSIDMRARPYDLAALGYEPIFIETSEGRELYRTEQLALSEEGQTLRSRLLGLVRLLQQSLTTKAIRCM